MGQEFGPLPWLNSFLERASSRIQLWKLRNQTSTTALQREAEPVQRKSHFVLYGWQWHHLAIVRDLARLQAVLQKRRDVLCPNNASEMQVEEAKRQKEGVGNALNYIVEGWAIHNDVERRLFFPWLTQQDQGSSQRLETIRIERQRLEKTTSALQDRLKTWSAQTCSPTSNSNACLKQLTQLRHTLKSLEQDATTLFQTSEASLMPLVKNIEIKKQRALNMKIIRSIGQKAIRLQIVTFQDAIYDTSAFANATVKDRKNFEKEVPGPVKAMLPLWKRRFLKPVMPFLEP